MATYPWFLSSAADVTHGVDGAGQIPGHSRSSRSA